VRIEDPNRPVGTQGPLAEAPHGAPWRAQLHEIIFESDTREGFAFDVALLAMVGLSVLIISLASIESLRLAYGPYFSAAEWMFTLLFTVEYVLRLLAVRRPLWYATSFFGVVDLLSILPSYLSLLLPGAQSLLVLRVVRFVRIFRILKLSNYLVQSATLWTAISKSRQKITVFLTVVASIVTIMGALMYVVEGPESGFTSIPVGMYWAVVTLTTVGYGDISPKTALGQAIASFVMILGYAILAVPTGIVSVELAEATRKGQSPETCPGCGREGHDTDARFCKYCGTNL
jgi:voltage-gated potassium channel